MDIQELKKIQGEIIEIICFLAIDNGDKEEVNHIQKQAIEIINNKDFIEHINDEVNGLTILDHIQELRERLGDKCIEELGIKKIEEAIKKAIKELGRVSNLNNDSESENALELESGSVSESEIDYQARCEYQTLQQNINLAKKRSVLSAISLIATTGILVYRILYSIEHEERLELMSSGVLFLGCLNFLSIGLIFNSNSMIRSNRDQISTLLANTADQQIVQQVQNR